MSLKEVGIQHLCVEWQVSMQITTCRTLEVTADFKADTEIQTVSNIKD